MKERIRKGREEAKRKKEEEERLKREREQEERDRLEMIKKQRAEEIARRKEENRIKQQLEKEESERKKKEEIEAQQEFIRKQQEHFKSKGEELKKKREEEEEEEKRIKLQQLREAEEAEKLFKQKLLERKQQVREQEEKKKIEQEQARKEREEQIKKDMEEQKKQIQLQIELAKEEARKKKEEEQQQLEAARIAKEQEQQRIIQERNRIIEEQKEKKRLELEQQAKERQKQLEEQKRLEEEQKEEKKRRRQIELEQYKKQQEEEERKKREEATLRLQKLEEEARIAREKHVELARKRKEEERNVESEEQRKREEERNREFELEQERRRKELETAIHTEEKRRKVIEEKMKENKNPINKCGLFTVFGEEPGLEIWVIGDQIISKLAKNKHGLRGLIGESHGSFHVEKVYIILHTAYSTGIYHYRLYLWIGSRAPKDMIEQAHQRLEELKEGLQFQEIISISTEKEREESKEFKEYFNNTIEYVEAVNLKEIEGPNRMKKKLYQIKGRNFIHCKLVKPAAESLNSGDVFLLEDSFGIYQFNGHTSNKMERGKGFDFGVQLRIERNSRCKVTLIDEKSTDADAIHEKNKFWASLLLERDENDNFIVPDGVQIDKSVAKSTPTGLEKAIEPESGDDNEYEMDYIASWKLYKIGPIQPPDILSVEEIEKLENEIIELEIPKKGPTVDMLIEWNSYILDCGTEIFQWFGNFSSTASRNLCQSRAEELSKQAGRDQSFISLVKVRQRTEPYIFKEKFLGNWGDAYTDFDFNPDVRGNIAQLKQEEINIDCMYHPEKYEIASEDARMPIPVKDLSKIDSYKLSIWIIYDNDKFALPQEEYGIFYSENCYMIVFERRVGDLVRNVVYYWQGSHSSREDRGTSALFAGNLSQQLRFSQVRQIEQNKEPDHFISHFYPKMLILLGKRTSPTKYGDLLAGKHLFQVRGSNEVTTYAIETSLSAENLNTNDSFILVNNNSTFVWSGKGSNQFENEVANELGKLINPHNLKQIQESTEPAEFWSALQGPKGVYNSSESLRSGDVKGILFECTNIIGIFKVYRLESFSQSDLISRNCAILDVFDKIYVWIGGEANKKCIEMAHDTAVKYLNFENEDTPKRKPCEIITCHANQEPLEFKAYFHTWDPFLASVSKHADTKFSQFKNNK